MISFDDVASRVVIGKTFRPNPANRAVYDGLFREFLQVYKRNKGIFGRLAEPTRLKGRIKKGSDPFEFRGSDPLLIRPLRGAVSAGAFMGLTDRLKNWAKSATSGVAAAVEKGVRNVPGVERQIEKQFESAFGDMETGLNPTVRSFPSLTHPRKSARTGKRSSATCKALRSRLRKTAGRRARSPAASTTATRASRISSAGSTPSTPRPTRCTPTCGPAPRSSRPRSWP